MIGRASRLGEALRHRVLENRNESPDRKLANRVSNIYVFGRARVCVFIVVQRIKQVLQLKHGKVRNFLVQPWNAHAYLFPPLLGRAAPLDLAKGDHFTLRMPPQVGQIVRESSEYVLHLGQYV